MTFESIYRDIVPQQRIVYTSTMSAGDDVMTVSLTTVECRPAEAGTRGWSSPSRARSWTAGRNRPGGSTALPPSSTPSPRSSRKMADLQAAIQAAADEMVASGPETGLQIAVHRHGHVVADVVSGVADPRTGAGVSPGTLFYAVSAAKGVAASLAHVLAERGDLGYDLRLAEVWPEFGTRGKDRVTVRHVLLHTAGLPGLPRETTVEQLCDWDHMCAVLAAAEPWWEPGTRFGYHALTFGFLLGETMRRVTGRTVTELLREVLTGPLGVQDEVCFAVPPRLLPRVAWPPEPEQPGPQPPEEGSPLDRATPPALRDAAGFGRRADVLTSDIPSLGTMTARGVARVYSALLGHVDGATLVSEQRLKTMTAIAFTGLDEVMGFRTAGRSATAQTVQAGVPSRRGSTFGMVGANGSAFQADTAKFRQSLSERADEYAKISEESKPVGGLHHQFGIGDGYVLVVDEWDSVEHFQAFMANPDLQAFIGSVGGAPEPPEVIIAEAVASADQF